MIMKLYTALMMMNTEFFVIYVKNLRIERFFKNHLKSGTHINNIRKRQL